FHKAPARAARGRVSNRPRQVQSLIGLKAYLEQQWVPRRTTLGAQRMRLVNREAGRGRRHPVPLQKREQAPRTMRFARFTSRAAQPVPTPIERTVAFRTISLRSLVDPRADQSDLLFGQWWDFVFVIRRWHVVIFVAEVRDIVDQHALGAVAGFDHLAVLPA